MVANILESFNGFLDRLKGANRNIKRTNKTILIASDFNVKSTY